MQSAKVAIHRLASSEGAVGLKHVFEALKDVAESRATRQMIKEALSAGVKAHIIVPVIEEDCQVDPRQLGRALRQVIRGCIEEGRGGADLGIGFSFADPKELEILGAPLEEIAPTLVGKIPN